MAVTRLFPRMPRPILARLGQLPLQVRLPFDGGDYVGSLRNSSDAKVGGKPPAIEKLAVDQLAQTELATGIVDALTSECAIGGRGFDHAISEYLKKILVLKDQVARMNRFFLWYCAMTRSTWEVAPRARWWNGAGAQLNRSRLEGLALVKREPSTLFGPSIISAQFLSSRSKEEAMRGCVEDLRNRCESVARYVVNGVLLSGAMNGFFGAAFWTGSSECWNVHSRRTTFCCVSGERGWVETRHVVHEAHLVDAFLLDSVPRWLKLPYWVDLMLDSAPVAAATCADNRGKAKSSSRVLVEGRDKQPLSSRG
jgi:hypothetical protein